MNLQIIELVILGIALINVLGATIFVLYAKLPNGVFRDTVIRKTIYELDRFADNMENPAKRSSAIGLIRDALGWKKIFVPTTIIGFIIDSEVAVVRKLQEVNKIDNMHGE